jgi:L-amino acid N-acyltransferase YncA
MITLQLERVSDCWDELYPLARHHQASTASYRRHEPFNPDKTRYIEYNEMGFFHLVTARDGARLVGYFGLYVTKSMHSQLLMATEDTFYVHPDYRQGRLALRIIRYVERYLTTLGVHEILFSCEIDNTSGIQGLLRLLGYESKIQQFSKHLSTSADSAATVADVGAHEPARPAPSR